MGGLRPPIKKSLHQYHYHKGMILESRIWVLLEVRLHLSWTAL